MQRRIAIDANLCVLLVYGLLGPGLIVRNKRLSAFDETDFRLLERFVGNAADLLLTPNVVTETSNLVRYGSEPYRTSAAAILSSIVRAGEERYVKSRTAVSHVSYLDLGITDCVLLALLDEGATLLTTDLDLHVAATRAGLRSTNFNHLRDVRPDFR